MTRLDESQLLVGLQPAYGISEFNTGDDTTVSGGNGGNALGFIPSAAFYYVHSVTPDFKLGISTGSNFGSAPSMSRSGPGAIIPRSRN